MGHALGDRYVRVGLCTLGDLFIEVDAGKIILLAWRIWEIGRAL